MFSNPSGKIRVVGYISFGVGVLASLAGAWLMLCFTEAVLNWNIGGVIGAIAIALIGSALSWAMSLFICGFATLVESAQYVAYSEAARNKKEEEAEQKQ